MSPSDPAAGCDARRSVLEPPRVAPVTGDSCEDCSTTDFRTNYGGVLLCDRCLDKRVAAQTGFPQLPDPPAPVTIADGTGRRRRLRFRVWRAPTGIVVELEEMDMPAGDGYRRAVLGAHDANVDELVVRLRELAEIDLTRQFLEPNRYRPGWVLADDTVEGRLVWSDSSESGVGTPYDVVVDGHKLSWEELGRALEAYEGWRFRLEFADRVDDLRPDAEVVSLTTAAAESPRVDSPTPCIQSLFDEFLSEQRRRLSARTYSNYEAVIDLLQSCLNNYGYEHLDDADRIRFDAAFERDSEAFVHLFGARELVGAIPEFLEYFMVRKVMASSELLRSAGTVTKKLAEWLGGQGYLDRDLVLEVAKRGADAARDLPRAEKLSNILQDLAEKTHVDLDAVTDEDYVDDQLLIDRVEPGALWFEGSIGPLKVPKAASDLAQPGWSANVALARIRGSWWLVEIGSVYP
jgi:hypothetical protein